MISFQDSPITQLVETALQHQALDEFASAVVESLSSTESVSTEQKLAVRIVTDQLVRSGQSPEAILSYVMNGDWTTGSVAVAPLTDDQRAGIIQAVITQAKAVLNGKAAELTGLAATSYALPTAEGE